VAPATPAAQPRNGRRRRSDRSTGFGPIRAVFRPRPSGILEAVDRVSSGDA
jgi:hypothetical protein